MKIFKYPLKREMEQTVLLPESAEILDIQLQNGQYQLWALLEPTDIMRVRTIRMFGTGFEVEEGFPGQYIATTQEGMFVWHWFET